MSVMKIMVVDRDRETTENIESFSEDLVLTHLEYETTKDRAIERIRNEDFDAVFFDPAPKADDLRPFILGVRRDNEDYVPITVMSRQVNREEAISKGANDFISKPLYLDDLKNRIQNIKNLNDFIERLRDENDDFISRDGVIAKTAFYQLFRSSLDRADRYGERTYLIFVSIDNIKDIEAMQGKDIADEICANLKKYTVKIRRLSDIVGRIAAHELCLMIVRPANSDEPMLAVHRFADSIKDCVDVIGTEEVRAAINIKLMEVPNGKIHFSETYN